MMNMTGQQECHCATYKNKGTCNCFWKMNFILLGLTAVGFLIPFLKGNYSWSVLFGGSGLVILSIISGGWVHRGTNAEGVQKRAWWLFAELALILLFLVVFKHLTSPILNYKTIKGISLSSTAYFFVFLIPVLGVSGLARLRPVNLNPLVEKIYFPVLFALLVSTFYIFGPDIPLVVSWLVMCLWGWGIFLFVRDLLTPGEQQLLKKEVMEQRWVLWVVMGLVTALMLFFSKTMVAMDVIFWIVPLLVIYNGSRLMSGESNHHTLEYLVTRPLSINRIFWIKYLVGVLVPLYLFSIVYLQDEYFCLSQNNYIDLKYPFLVFTLITILTLLMYNFFVFFSALIKDIVRTIVIGIAGGIIIGSSVWIYVTYNPFSLLAMTMGISVVDHMKYPVHISLLALASLGIVGIVFSSQLRKRLVWNSYFTGFAVIGLVGFLSYQPIFVGPMPKITPYGGQLEYRITDGLRVRGNKIILQRADGSFYLLKLNPDKTITEDRLELNAGPDRDQYRLLADSVNVLNTDMVVGFYSETSVLVKKMSLDTLDKTTIRVMQIDSNDYNAGSVTTWRSQIVSTPRVLQSVKLPCMKDYWRPFFFVDSEGIHVQAHYMIFNNNPQYDLMRKAIDSEEKMKTVPFNIAAVETTYRCLETYLLNKGDLSVISHQTRGREYNNPFWQSYDLIQGRYQFIGYSTYSYDSYYGIAINEGDLIDVTKTGPAAKAGRIHKIIRQSCTDKKNLIYIQPNDKMLEIYDVSDIHNPRMVGELYYPLRDSILQNKSYYCNMELKDNLLLMWSSEGYYVIDINSPEKPRIVSSRTVPTSGFAYGEYLQWDPAQNAFRMIAYGARDRLFIGDYPPITK